jgi:hypothetical protein
LCGRLGGGFGRKLADFEAHLSPSLELDHTAFRDRHLGSRCARIAPGPRFAHPDFEDAEVAQLNLFPFRQGLRNMIKRPLDDVEHLLLNHIGILADAKYQIALCQSHRLCG